MPVTVTRVWPCSIAILIPSGIVYIDRVRVAEREHDLLALDLGAVADADDVELLA